MDAVSADDVWAVGNITDADSGSSTPGVEHWDGSVWSVVPSAPNSSVYSVLTGVSAISANDVWAVGAYVNDASELKTYAEHWDGHRWKSVRTPSFKNNSAELNSVTAVGTDDVLAVGNELPSSGPDVTVTLHWNGSHWKRVNSPSPKGAEANLTSVAATSADDAWAVGYGVSTPTPTS